MRDGLKDSVRAKSTCSPREVVGLLGYCPKHTHLGVFRARSSTMDATNPGLAPLIDHDDKEGGTYKMDFIFTTAGPTINSEENL